MNISIQTTQEMVVKDALGRVPISIGMAILKFEPGGVTEEFYVYGNERVALIVPNTLGTTPSLIQHNEATYFLTDHLGNTRVAYMPTPTSNPYIINAVDYYPYGKVLREYDNGAGDRYLSTQHERDKETGLDYRGARYYDSDIARFLSLDPLAAKYPMLSPYNYVAGNPIIFIDPDGREIWIINEYYDDKGMMQKERVRYCDGILYTESGERYSGDNQYFHKVAHDLKELSESGQDLNDRIVELQESKNIHEIGMPSSGEYNGATSNDRDKRNNGEPTGSTVRYDPDKRKTRDGDDRDPRAGLAHELLGHSYDYDKGTTRQGETSNGIPLNEVDAVNIENKARVKTGDKKRTKYVGLEIPVELLNK
ncbi:hypothetical protein D3C71_644270 [compost metagenome]